MAADGCHNHRASGTCHCHRVGASRPGCTGEYREDGGEQGAGRGDEAPADVAEPSADQHNPVSTAPPAAPAEWIRIATWNLNRLHWRIGGALWRGAAARSGEDYRTLARYARALDADVIAFQEVNGPRAAARVFPPRDYDLHFSGRYDSRYDDIYNGYAVRKGTFDRVVKRDHEALGLGSGSRFQLRWGVDLLVSKDGQQLRLLNVHLKSKCFRKRLRSPRSRACRTLARQIEPLEAWIDARWREGVPFVVLGDFNRELDRHGERDHLWAAIADGDPPGLALHRVSAGRDPACWRGTSRHFRYPDRLLRVRRARLDARGRRVLPAGGVDRRGRGPAPRPALRSLSDCRGSLLIVHFTAGRAEGSKTAATRANRRPDRG